MKFVLICFNEAIDDEVIEVLNKAQVSGYTKWTKVLGKGKSSGPHLYSHVWPKANNVLATVVSEDTADAVLKDIRKMREKLGSEGIKAFIWEIKDVT